MGKPLSMNVRERVIGAIEAGLSRRAAADRHGVAPMTLDGPINGDWFEACLRHVLIPTLHHGDVVIMDNLSSHRRASVREIIEASGARLLFLPPYSPGFNPIEMAFAKLKAMPRKVAERAADGLWNAIGQITDRFTPQTDRKTL